MHAPPPAAPRSPDGSVGRDSLQPSSTPYMQRLNSARNSPSPLPLAATPDRSRYMQPRPQQQPQQQGRRLLGVGHHAGLPHEGAQALALASFPGPPPPLQPLLSRSWVTQKGWQRPNPQLLLHFTSTDWEARTANENWDIWSS